MSDPLRKLALKDGRYATEAFTFLYESLDHAVRLAGREHAEGTDRPTSGGSTEPTKDADQPKAALAVEAAPRAESTAEQPMSKTDLGTGVADAARVISSSPAPASELSVIAGCRPMSIC